MLKSYTTVTLESGKHAVLLVSPQSPANLEIVATFYDFARAQKYADQQNGLTPVHQQKDDESIHANTNSKDTNTPDTSTEIETEIDTSTKFVNPPTEINYPELSEQQVKILDLLKTKMDERNQVQLGNGKIAEAIGVKIGSIFYALQRLEEKGYIQSEKRGFGGAATIWEILDKGLTVN